MGRRPLVRRVRGPRLADPALLHLSRPRLRRPRHHPLPMARRWLSQPRRTRCWLPLAARDRAIATTNRSPTASECTNRNGPAGWHEHNPDVFERCERFFRPGYAANLTSTSIPALDGVEAKLRAGARVADVGCGHRGLDRGARPMPSRPRRSSGSTTTRAPSAGFSTLLWVPTRRRRRSARHWDSRFVPARCRWVALPWVGTGAQRE